MPQNPIEATIATTPSNVQTQAKTDTSGNLRVTTTPQTSFSSTGPLGIAAQIRSGTGTLQSVDNLLIGSLTTTAVGSLTTSQIGAFYDVALTTSTLGPLSTTQVAALTTSSLLGLAVPTISDIPYGGGAGIPYKLGLVFIPGGGLGTPAQLVNVTYK